MNRTRRDFLKQASGSAIALSVADGGWFAGTAQATAPVGRAEQGEVFDRPMRWAQLAFVEDDPGNYDQAFWLEYFKRIHADGATLSAGGVVAFYPTEVPLHYRSRWLGNRDSFGDLAAGCRKLGMNVLARTDPHACHDDVHEAHPGWIMVDEQGNKRRHPADPTLWLTCPFGGYNFEFMTAVHEEITRRYQPDGIFCNRWAGYGSMCWCEHCRTAFRKATGLELPSSKVPQQDAAKKAYAAWRENTLFDLWHLWDSRMRAINPGTRFIGNSGGGAFSDLSMKTLGEIAPTLFADKQARNGYMAVWANGKNAKEFRATMGTKPIGGIFSVGVEEPPRWKDSVQNGDEIRLWVADGIAQGFRPWFTKFNAKLIDRRWLPVVEEIYTWHHANESYLRNERSLARVAMVYSQQTARVYGGGDARGKVEDAGLGFYQAMVEARIPFDMVHDGLLHAPHLQAYDTLVLPNIAALSDVQCAQLQAFVERGGGLVATYETSLYDEDGVARKEFGLSTLFGATFAGSAHGPMQNSYLELEEKADSPGLLLLKGLEGVPRILNAVNQVETKPLPGGLPSPLGVIPSYPDLPMEEVFQRSRAVSGPGVYLSKHGSGRVAYFPGDLDRTFWSYLNVDQGAVLANAVRWAMPSPPPVEVKGKGLVDLAVWRQKKSITVHLVNLTNPMAMKGPIREVIPMPSQTVLLRLVAGDRIVRVRLLVAGKEAPHHREGDVIHVDVATAGIHEVVAFDLA